MSNEPEISQIAQSVAQNIEDRLSRNTTKARNLKLTLAKSPIDTEKARAQWEELQEGIGHDMPNLAKFMETLSRLIQ